MNGLDIVRDITFYNKDFLSDSKTLIPVQKDFFEKYPLINPRAFLGDASFDLIERYKSFTGSIL